MKQLLIALAMGSVVAIAPVMTALAQSQPSSIVQLFPALVGVELNPTQTAELTALSQQILPKVKRLLSPTQAQQFDVALAQGKSVRIALSSVNLSMSQQFKLTRELQSVRSKITAMLTTTQQQQLTQNARALQSSH